MSPSHTEEARPSLSETLQALLALPEGESICLSDLFARVGDRGFGLLLIVLSLPSALPLPAAGYSIPFGILLSIIALQMIRGAPAPVAPGRAGRVTLNRKLLERMSRGGIWLFGKIERLIRPRMRWIGQRSGRVLMGVLVLIMAGLMMIPIPSTNTAPAFIVFLIGVGLSEEDGLFALFACVGGMLAVCFYAFLIYLISIYGMDAVDMVKDWVRGLF